VKQTIHFYIFFIAYTNIQKNKTNYELLVVEQFKNTKSKTYCILNLYNLLDFYEFFKLTSSLIISKLIELCYNHLINSIYMLTVLIKIF